ncbi:MAG: hypothetical protein V7721_10960 [Porticoccaceae bacterium]
MNKLLNVIMKCKHCSKEFEIQQAIEASLFSWPQMKTIWYVCPQCEEGNHIRFDKGSVQLVQPQGSPGYEYDVISTIMEPTIEIRIDPKFLHIWYMGKHHEIRERA